MVVHTHTPQSLQVGMWIESQLAEVSKIFIDFNRTIAPGKPGYSDNTLVSSTADNWHQKDELPHKQLGFEL